MIGTRDDRGKTPDLVRQVKICSWNVRWVRDMFKRQAIFSMAGTGEFKMLCLQETHLEKGTISALRHRNYQVQYHSTHTSYSRGVSTLINSGLVFSCRQSKVDENGWYIFLFCAIESRECVLVIVYIPPPFSTEIMCDLIRFIADKPGVPVIVADFHGG